MGLFQQPVDQLLRDVLAKTLLMIVSISWDPQAGQVGFASPRSRIVRVRVNSL
jgi:hypothetical protein